MYQASRIELGRLAQDLQLKRKQVENVVELLDAGNTVPFITRYRKELTGGLDEEQIRSIQHRVQQLRQLAERRDTILRSLEAQGKLTDALKASIESASTMKRLEDLYLPFKPKKQTLATIARDRGLGPLAEAIWANDETVANLDEILQGVLDPEKQPNTPQDVLTGVQHILAEKISEDADVRAAARQVLWAGKLHTSRSTATAATEAAGEGQEAKDSKDAEFRNYFDYSESLSQIPPHRILAINRGERLGILKIRLEYDRPQLDQAVEQKLPLENHAHADFLKKCAADAVDRLLLRSLEREVRGELSERAEQHAVEVFARNLRNLLLQPPVRNHRVLAIDPGYRSGCKVAVVDEFGNLLDHDIVFPHNRRKKKKKKKKSEAKESTNKVAAAEPVEQKTEPANQTDDREPPPILPADSFYRSVPPGDPHDEMLDAQAAEQANKPLEEAPSEAEDTTEVVAPENVEASREPLSESAAQLVEEAVEGSTSGQDEQPSQEPPLSTVTEIVASEEPAAADVRVEIAVTPPEKVDEEAAVVAAEPASEDIFDAASLALFAQPEPKTAEPKQSAGPQKSKRQSAVETIQELCRKHNVKVIAIGNGTGCRETEEFIAELIAESQLQIPYVIVNESGASVYSTSPVGREEFPDFDPTLRGTISIARRLQDPLSELVKIEPQNIGVGLYQHDVNPRRLKESLSEVVESCVNYVGVDVNTASVQILQYISGLNQLRARNLVEYRKEKGPFATREQIKEVNGIGPAVFTQAAGFLRTDGEVQPFDTTWIHPESYETATKVLELIGYEPSVLKDRARMQQLREKLAELDAAQLAEKIGVGEPTIRDILDNLARPGHDPREDLPKPIFKEGILRLEDLTPGMQLQGTVLNVVDFGAFVDVGLKDSCLVHISELANRFIRSPHDVVSVGDIVTTWVLKVDTERRRVSLTMIPPDTVRAHPSNRQRQRPRTGAAPRQQQQPARTQATNTPGTPAQNTGRRPSQRRDSRPAPTPSDRGGKKPTKVQRHKKSAPPPKLSSEALEGKAALHTFGELKAFFDHKRKKSDTDSDSSGK